MDRPAKQESQTQTIFEKMRNKKVAATLAIGVGIAALSGCATDTNAEPKPSQSHSAEATPSETPSPEATNTPEGEGTLEQQIEALRIPEGLSDEDLAEAYIELSNKWWTAGATDELRMERLEENLSWEEFVPIVAARNAELYGPAMFGSDWDTNPALQEEVAGNIAGNENFLLNYTATAWNTENPENKEPYTSWMEVAQVTNVVSTDTERTLKITYNNFNNADQNSVPDDALRPSGAVEVVFTPVDGFEDPVSVQRQ